MMNRMALQSISQSCVARGVIKIEHVLKVIYGDTVYIFLRGSKLGLRLLMPAR